MNSEQSDLVESFNDGSRCFVCHFDGAIPPGKDFSISDPTVWAPSLASFLMIWHVFYIHFSSIDFVMIFHYFL